MIKLYVGDCGQYLSDIAGPNSVLLTGKNYQTYLETTYTNDVVFHTSMADLPKITNTEAALYSVMCHADTIVYEPPKVWSDDDGTYRVANSCNITKYFLSLLVDKHIIGDYSSLGIHYCDLLDTRKNSSCNLFVTGCSYSKGVGVNNDQRFPVLIANQLQLPLVDLAKGGSSNEFHADQILRSNINKNDIVLWGITQELRRSEWNNGKENTKSWNRDTFSETSLYKSVIAIHQVKNFCNKIQARLLLVPLLCSENLIVLINTLPEYVQLPYQTQHIDFGFDGVHPGPQQHQVYANKILDQIARK